MEENTTNTNSFLDYFNIFKYFIDLNPQAKAVIAILSFVVIFLGYRNYELNEDLVKERLRYDQLSDKYTKASDIIKKDNEKIYRDFQEKLDDYRDKRDREVNLLLNDYKEKAEKLQQKVEQYEQRIK